MLVNPHSQGELRQARRLLGLSLDEFSHLAGISASFLSRVERGLARLHPDAERALLRECEALIQARRSLLSSTLMTITCRLAETRSDQMEAQDARKQ
jgi:transcriptional regulator with XRE-family HTH domain